MGDDPDGWQMNRGEIWWPSLRDAVVNVSQIVTLDKSALNGCVGRLSRGRLEAAEEGMRLVLDPA